MADEKVYRAVIVRKGRCREDGFTEPYATLTDPETGDVGKWPEPMGWNRMGAIYEVGITGTARYIATATSGLYRFTPDPHETYRGGNGMTGITLTLEQAKAAIGLIDAQNDRTVVAAIGGADTPPPIDTVRFTYGADVVVVLTMPGDATFTVAEDGTIEEER